MRTWPLLAAACLAAAPAVAEPAEPLSALARMPVREVTVFKDGHALVVHEGALPITPRGEVRMDYLPMPVLGTFWSYSRSPGTRVVSVTAGTRRVRVVRTALSVRELLEGNPGARVLVREKGGRTHEGRIAGLPRRSAEELEATLPPGAPPQLPQQGTVLLLATAKGTQALPIDLIQQVEFRAPFVPKTSHEELRSLLTLRLNRAPGKTARVGMLYLQRGLRWIPAYRVRMDGKGSATLSLQADLLNEMVDLKDATVNLVIGVPSFFFRDTPDPIGVQDAFARLSPYFQPGSATGFAMNNAIMGQTARMGEVRGGRRGAEAVAPPDVGIAPPELMPGAATEDLFVFTVRRVSLKRGERMVLPVAELTLPYRDIYTLDVPIAPPEGVHPPNLTPDREADLARLLAAPRVEHSLRLENTSRYPLTTAPALVLSGETVLSQGLMTYTSPGATTDLEVTAAVDVRVKREDREVKRAPEAGLIDGYHYARVDMRGTIGLTNHAGREMTISVTRHVLGQVDQADHGGRAETASLQEGPSYSPRYPSWWYWFNWPSWWWRLNGLGRFTWEVTLRPGETVDLGCAWHQFL
ncbi:MAG: hypothetical protein IT208_12850 [Chthonomonadales bacterium]|nr:hypothetical protein [Chthonomonadales bacterium]